MPSPARRSWRPLIARLHFYAGVLVAPFIVVAAVTGGLYALPLTDQVLAARNAFPDLVMTGLRPPATGTDSTRVYFADPTLDEESLRAAFVDPHTGRVLGDEATWFGSLPLSTWLDGLHRNLNLGEPGRIYSELAASWLWVVVLGGLYLWLVTTAGARRRGRAGRVLSVDRQETGHARTLNWHGATGVWLFAGLLFLSATGITWSTYAGAHVTDIRSALSWQRPQLDTALVTGSDAGEHSGHGGSTQATLPSCHRAVTAGTALITPSSSPYSATARVSCG